MRIAIMTLLALPVLAQTWNDGPLVPVWTPQSYEWGMLRGGFRTVKENNRKYIDIDMPDVAALTAQVATLTTQIATLQGQVTQLSSRVAELEKNTLPPPSAPVAYREFDIRLLPVPDDAVVGQRGNIWFTGEQQPPDPNGWRFIAAVAPGEPVRITGYWDPASRWMVWCQSWDCRAEGEAAHVDAVLAATQMVAVYGR